MSAIDSGSIGWLNIGENNMRDYVRIQHEEDTLYGRPLSTVRGERTRNWIREKCITGQVFSPEQNMSESDTQRMREFVANHLAHRKDAEAVLPLLGGKQLFVRLDGALYHVRRSYAASNYEMPVIVSEANVVGD